MRPGVGRFQITEVPEGLKRHTLESNYGRCAYQEGGVHYGFLNRDGECHRCARQEKPEKKRDGEAMPSIEN
jgi:hypothetical protein